MCTHIRRLRQLCGLRPSLPRKVVALEMRDFLVSKYKELWAQHTELDDEGQHSQALLIKLMHYYYYLCIDIDIDIYI